MPDFGGNVARMQEFSALLELGLSRVFKDDLPTHPKLYKDWLATKKANEFIEDELVTTGFGPMPEIWTSCRNTCFSRAVRKP